MKETFIVAGLATALALGIGSVSAKANPASSAFTSFKPGSSLILKADWDDHAHWRWRHRHRDWDRDGWRGRWWWWHRHHGWDRDDWRRRHHRRDWDDRR